MDLKRSRRARWWVLGLFAGLALFLAWAAVSEIGQTVHAPGQVIVRARTQVIQAPIDGVVTRIAVREGDAVRQGQQLASFDAVQAQAAVDDARGKVAALMATQARARSEVLGVPLSFPAEVLEFPEFAQNQRLFYAARRRALEEDISALDRSLALIREQIAISRPLVAAGDIGRLELVSLQQREAELIGTRANRRNKYFADAQAEMTKAEEELATAKQMLADRSETLARTSVVSPVDGVVKRLAVTTEGARVRPGDVMIEIVPTGGARLFEARLPPADVSYVQPGLPASLKLDAYDYSIYGSLETKVLYVSPDAMTERTPQGETTYYTIQVALPQADVEAWNRHKRGDQAIVLQPGMSGSVDIHTGERTILSYLTKPINKTLNTALSER